MPTLYTGYESLVQGALDSEVSLATGVPGYPINEIMGLLMDSSIEARWSINEKVALEAALGASAVGRRSVVIVKHVGMNILADPLITSATHTIGAGIVIISGDDPGAEKSQNEQDSRYYGLLAEVLVFDPANPIFAYSSISNAFQLSEEVSAPVIIRVTERLNNIRNKLQRKISEFNDFPKFDRKIWSYTHKGRHQRFHKQSYPKMLKASTKSGMNIYHNRGKEMGIISSGYVSSLVEEVISEKYKNVSHLALTLINPLPRPMIDEFIKKHSRVLVIEETEPVIEQQISQEGVVGKLTGHVGYKKIETNNIILALKHIHHNSVIQPLKPQTIKSRGFSKTICEDCPYNVLYKVIGTLDVPVAGDVGCSIKTAPPPMEVVDMAYSLGSSIATATGFDKKGIALIGDYGLVHTGLQGLIEAAFHKKDVLVVVLQNNIAALTGGQNVPDMTDVIKCIVPESCISINVENLNEKKLLAVLQSELKKKGVSVVLARGKCTLY
ncbi:MAG: indolepyruvate ferredoxin oxidoreductase [Nitrospirae bacterium]|nr:indolepyruvate ferredoxin oxidoreductase [Nitrospirota bacterium]